MKNITEAAGAVVETVSEVVEESNSLITPKRLLITAGIALVVGGSIWGYKALKKRAQAEEIDEQTPAETVPTAEQAGAKPKAPKTTN